MVTLAGAGLARYRNEAMKYPLHSAPVLAFALVCSWLPSTGGAAENVIPGTKPLTIVQPLDEVMVAGIDRYALRELAASPARRDQASQRDFSSAAAYAKSVAAPRERLRGYIGAVDARAAATDFEPLTTVGRDARVGESDRFTVLAVRWAVIEGLTGEGLLLQPKGAVKGRMVVIPDADWTPEQFTGLAGGVAAPTQLPRRLAAQGWQVLVPMIISRGTELSGSQYVRFTNQPQREFIYRQAFEVGRHVIGYEVQKVLAAIDLFTAANERERTKLPLGVAGVGEGGLLALYASALDDRIDRTLVSGYFQVREKLWEEPIYRNVWALLTEFGDAELAGLIAPRALTIEACAVPEGGAPMLSGSGQNRGPTPGRFGTAPLASVRQEFDRAKGIFDRLKAGDRLKLVAAGNGTGAAGAGEALAALAGAALEAGPDAAAVKPVAPPAGQAIPNDPRARESRQFNEMQVHAQNLARLSNKVRDAKWAKADRTSPEKWAATVEPLRDWAYDEFIGRLPKSTMPLNPRTRLIKDAPWLKIHNDAFDTYEVVLDVYDDVIASGLLLLPKDLKPGERRPVVVTQHGLEGVPADTVGGPELSGYRAYRSFSAELCKRGFIVYSPQNPYRGGDAFRTLQRKSNILKRSLYSYIIPQHERSLEWLSTLPYVDPQRIAFYGLSYGGKTAVRVPPFVKQYCLSICSGDFNEWIRKITTLEDRPSYIFTGEYEIFEWNMAHVANYAELSNLMTPRPFMVERGHDDGVAIDEWVAWEFAKVFRHYNKMGLGHSAEIEYFYGPHMINGQATYRFLHRHLNWPEKR